MRDLGSITPAEYESALRERLRVVRPESGFLAPHFVERAIAAAGAPAPWRVETTLDAALQAEVAGILAMHHHRLDEHGTHNVAVAVQDNRRGEWLPGRALHRLKRRGALGGRRRYLDAWSVWSAGRMAGKTGHHNGAPAESPFVDASGRRDQSDDVRAHEASAGTALEFGCKEKYPLPTMKSTISSKGQVTVPVEIRDRLGLAAGTTVLFELRAEGVLLRKGSAGEHPVDRVFGTLQGGRAVDALAVLDRMRGPRPGGPRAKRR